MIPYVKAMQLLHNDCFLVYDHRPHAGICGNERVIPTFIHGRIARQGLLILKHFPPTRHSSFQLDCSFDFET